LVAGSTAELSDILAGLRAATPVDPTLRVPAHR
jgi:hypothetical protein